MYTKILVAEDLNSIHLGIHTGLKELHIREIVQVNYCDDAMLKLKKAKLDQEPFQLLITDLSFKKDHRNVTYNDGEALIEAAKAAFPELKIIAYSVEDRLQKVRRLIKSLKVDAFVCKGRNGLAELKEAIEATGKNKVYLSPQVATALKNNQALNIDDFDVLLLKFLAEGYIQEEISTLLKKKEINPNSLSTIEKRINKMKILLKSQNTVQLIAVSKDMGLI